MTDVSRGSRVSRGRQNKNKNDAAGEIAMMPVKLLWRGVLSTVVVNAALRTRQKPQKYPRVLALPALFGHASVHFKLRG